MRSLNGSYPSGRSLHWQTAKALVPHCLWTGNFCHFLTPFSIKVADPEGDAPCAPCIALRAHHARVFTSPSLESLCIFRVAGRSGLRGLAYNIKFHNGAQWGAHSHDATMSYRFAFQCAHFYQV